MAKVIPFRGVRYNLAKIGDPAAVVTPPYDVIDSAAQKKYYERHPFNMIRLELGYQFPTDNEADNRYLRAARDYRNWLAEGILVQEAEDAIYLYEQEFSVAGQTYRRTGFFARVQLEDYQSGAIRPHEETLAKPKADRLALMHTCQANFSPVFALYEDPAVQLEEEFEKVKKITPEIELTDEVGERHRVWVLTKGEIHENVTASLADKVLYIADGHHRYETALAFYEATKEKYPGAAYILMYLVNTRDPGLVILPTHRIVRNLRELDLPLFKDQLEQDFLVQKIAFPAPEQIQQILSKQQEEGRAAFIMATREPAAYLLIVKNPGKVKTLAPHMSAAWCSLDVTALHILIFQELLGIGPEKMSHQENLTYTRDEKEAVRIFLEEEGQLVFFLNPTRIEQVTAVAAAGDKMPQKSTYFYPKLLTGLILNDLTVQ
ncbi:MAG: DUF1015 domain-containing protein [Bacillota bacterium]|nr:DUF1015 domain-containing protein [Bacillota bacterium]